MGTMMLRGILRMPFNDYGDIHLTQLKSRCIEAADMIDRLEAEITELSKDKDRLDFMEEHCEGCGLVSDDAGRWAVSGTGTQNVPDDDHAIDIDASFSVLADEWKPSIREAIDGIRGVFYSTLEGGGDK